ncbi:MAG: hypothetical protein H3C35_09900 [Bacteroidetes bacterium]|nr:hypothetical protein [Bacteroidota bacterium]
MKILLHAVLLFVFSSSLYSQDELKQYDFSKPLTPEICSDVIKIVWTKLSDYAGEIAEAQNSKGEFESTPAFQNRLQSIQNNVRENIRKFSNDTKLNSRVFSVLLKAEFDHYDADHERYNIRTSTNIQTPPSKDFILLTCSSNQYVDVNETNAAGYRRSFLTMKKNPEFVWYVNNQIAQAAKQKEQSIYFTLWFSLEIDSSNPRTLVLQIIPKKISLIDTADNFTYWTEEIY